MIFTLVVSVFFNTFASCNCSKGSILIEYSIINNEENISHHPDDGCCLDR